jgi:hypothetical protein
MDSRKVQYLHSLSMPSHPERIQVPWNRLVDQACLLHCTAFRNYLSNLRSSAILLDALVAFVRQLELSTISEINQDCLSFLKECISNVSTYKNLLGNVLTLATVYGEKLDDSVIADKKKMRKDFGVGCPFFRSNSRIRTFAFSPWPSIRIHMDDRAQWKANKLR